MVYLEFVEERANGDVVYDYIPEKKTADRGTVLVNRDTRKPKKLKGSSDGDWWPEYYNRAWKRVVEIIDAGELKQATYSAWY